MWDGRASYDDNEKTPDLEKLRADLRAGEGSLDRRDYHSISLDKPKPAPADALYAVLHLDVFPPGLVATLEATRAVAAAARSGSGNFRYEVTQSVKPPISHTNLLSAWKSLEDFNAWQVSPEARQFRDTVGPLLGSPYEERLYTKIR